MRKINLLVFPIMYCSFFACSQGLPPPEEQQLENIAINEENTAEDDSYLQQSANWRNHPVNLNTADKDELAELRILNDLQIESLIRYRKLLGPIIDIHELQAIPAWDIPTIRKLLPFVTIIYSLSAGKELHKQFRD